MERRLLAKKLAFEYAKKFGFEYKLSETDATNCDVVENIRERLLNDYETEFANCCNQTEKIALEKLTKLI